jgi:hypothetical protein
VVIGPVSLALVAGGSTRDVLIDVDLLLVSSILVSHIPLQQGCLMGNTRWFPLCCEMLPVC